MLMFGTVVVTVEPAPLIEALPVTVHTYCAAPSTGLTLYPNVVEGQPIGDPRITEGDEIVARIQ